MAHKSCCRNSGRIIGGALDRSRTCIACRQKVVPTVFYSIEVAVSLGLAGEGRALDLDLISRFLKGLLLGNLSIYTGNLSFCGV